MPVTLDSLRDCTFETACIASHLAEDLDPRSEIILWMFLTVLRPGWASSSVPKGVVHAVALLFLLTMVLMSGFDLILRRHLESNSWHELSEIDVHRFGSKLRGGGNRVCTGTDGLSAGTVRKVLQCCKPLIGIASSASCRFLFLLLFKVHFSRSLSQEVFEASTATSVLWLSSAFSRGHSIHLW